MLDIYKQRSKLKLFLAIMGILILIITLLYSNYLAQNLKKQEENNAQLYKDAYDFLLNNQDLDADITFQDNLVSTYALPIIIKTDAGNLTGRNFSEELDVDSVFLTNKVKEFLASGQQPLESITGGYSKEMYFFNSDLLNYIKYFPFIQLLLVTTFIGLGYYFFNASRREEQNRVWVGMAKETAHQLGTPISAIIAWLIHLKENTTLDDDQNIIVKELHHDVERLELVADRFSKIGSKPELTKTDIVKEVRSMEVYMQKRAPRKVNFDFDLGEENIHFANINAHLFNWVLENLMRNSLDSMDGSGTLSSLIYNMDGKVYIEISDTGKGIPSSKFKTIFQPGYSTKKRGWGLGLSLSKRIVEEYHGGKIYVKSSKPNELTTITIRLPKTV